MNLHRRGFLSGLISAIAAPAIVRINNIMPVRFIPNNMLGIDEITREAIRLFVNTNYFIQNLNVQYDSKFIVGSQLKIRLPNDYKVTI